MEGTEDFHQLKLRFVDRVQHDYEVIRPIVLFSETVKARSAATQIDRTTVSDKAKRFVQNGMFGLIDGRTQAAGRKSKVYPPPVAGYILYLKQIYPPIKHREIVRILERKFGHKTNHHTVKAFLERYPIPVQLEFKLPTFREFEDAYEARYEVVRLFYEGWHRESIAGRLKLSERHVRRLIETFEQDGFAGLEDSRTRPAEHPENQLTLPFLQETLAIQTEYPRAGAFRVQGLLERRRRQEGRTGQVPSERTIRRALAINRLFFRAPGPWPRPPLKTPQAAPVPLPFDPAAAHQYWYIDIRYLVRLDGRQVYSIAILEGYSRSILAAMVSFYQDELAILQLLHAAIVECGCPAGIVSDNGSVFKAKTYLAVLEGLGIQPERIQKRKPWQNLIEAQFKIQLRLADDQFERAASLEALQTIHADFVQTFNTTRHWAHRNNPDGQRTPAEVLGQARGRAVDPDQLQRLFRGLHYDRTINRHGYISIQRFCLYAEPGLATRRVSVWIYEGWLRIEYEQALLAQYRYTPQPQRRALKAVSEPRLFRTIHVSPQLLLFELDEAEWRRIWRRPPNVPAAASQDSGGHQLPLLEPARELEVSVEAPVPRYS